MHCVFTSPHQEIYWLIALLDHDDRIKILCGFVKCEAYTMTANTYCTAEIAQSTYVHSGRKLALSGLYRLTSVRVFGQFFVCLFGPDR